MDIKETVTRQVGNDIITMTDERATLVTSQISENNTKGIDLYFNNCELIKEMRDTNGFYLLGYSSFKEYADEMFDSGETQAKNMCLIAKYFGKENADHSYTIVDKEILKKFSATQLYYIGQLSNFDGSITKAIDFYGFEYDETKKRYTTTTSTLRELVKFEKNRKKALSLSDFTELKSKLPTNTAEASTNESTAEASTNESTAEASTNESTAEANKKDETEKVDKSLFDDAKKQRDEYVLQLTQVEKIVFDDKMTDKKKVELLKTAFNNLKKVNNQ